MGNATSWLAQSLCPEEQALWVAAKSGDLAALRAGLARLTPETRYYAEWRDPVFGASPLANACAQGHLACVRELVAAGVDCNARDLQGNAPLHVAARAGKSEVVKQLLDTLAVDYFAKTTHRSQSALDIARHECRQATDGDAHKFIQCIEMIEKKICIHTGWLYQRADNLLSLAAGMSSLTSWKKRYCMVLRTENPNVVEIDLFPMRPGEKRPPCPSMELIFRASDGVQESSDITWLSHKQYRFAISAYSKSGINRVSAPQLVDFAASTQEELSAWKMFFANLRLNGSSQVANLYSAAAAARSADTTNYDDAASRQEQRDIERALRLSMQDARRNPRAQTAAALPSAPSFGGSSGTSAQTVVGPDGVEIVQQFGSYSDGNEPPVPIDASAATDRARDEDEGSGECVICFDGPQAAVCVPCGHNAICMDCAQELLDTTRQCPVCRQTVREVIKLYRV